MEKAWAYNLHVCFRTKAVGRRELLDGRAVAEAADGRESEPLGVMAAVAVGVVCVDKCADGGFERCLVMEEVVLVCLIVCDGDVADGWRLVLEFELVPELLRDVFRVL